MESGKKENEKEREREREGGERRGSLTPRVEGKLRAKLKMLFSTKKRDPDLKDFTQVFFFEGGEREREREGGEREREREERERGRREREERDVLSWCCLVLFFGIFVFVVFNL